MSTRFLFEYNQEEGVFAMYSGKPILTFGFFGEKSFYDLVGRKGNMQVRINQQALKILQLI